MLNSQRPRGYTRWDKEERKSLAPIDTAVPAFAVKPLTAERVSDFRRVHAGGPGNGWCQCVAWWVPTWEGWGERSAEQNREVRDGLFRNGEYDGFLLYLQDEPVGWMQVGRIGRLPKLWQAYRLEDLPVTAEDLALSCVFLLPEHRGQGHLHRFLAAVLTHLADAAPPGRERRILAFPRRGRHPDDDVWMGPEGVFTRAGFTCLREGERPVLLRRI